MEKKYFDFFTIYNENKSCQGSTQILCTNELYTTEKSEVHKRQVIKFIYADVQFYCIYISMACNYN